MIILATLLFSKAVIPKVVFKWVVREKPTQTQKEAEHTHACKHT